MGLVQSLDFEPGGSEGSQSAKIQVGNGEIQGQDFEREQSELRHLGNIKRTEIDEVANHQIIGPSHRILGGASKSNFSTPPWRDAAIAKFTGVPMSLEHILDDLVGKCNLLLP